MVDTAEVERWLTEVERHVGGVIEAVEHAARDPLGAEDGLLRAGEEALRWLGMDPGPWSDLTDVMKAVTHSCIGYGLTAADLVRCLNDPLLREHADTGRLYALGDRMLAEIEMLGLVGRRHGLGRTPQRQP